MKKISGLRRYSYTQCSVQISWSVSNSFGDCSGPDQFPQRSADANGQKLIAFTATICHYHVTNFRIIAAADRIDWRRI